jgi:hypothetical protein
VDAQGLSPRRIFVYDVALVFGAAPIAVVLTSIVSEVTFAQSKPSHTLTAPHAMMSTEPISWNLAGKWTYRSYLNAPDVMVGSGSNAAATALSLLFGEGVMTLSVTPAHAIAGTFDMGSGYVLDLKGTEEVQNGRTAVAIAGVGRRGTPTDGWEYDYDGVLTKRWSKGVNQIPAIVGSVFRAKAHGQGAPAGFVATFMAVKQP